MLQVLHGCYGCLYIYGNKQEFLMVSFDIRVYMVLKKYEIQNKFFT